MKFKAIFPFFLLSFLLPLAITITLSNLGLLEIMNRKLVDGVMKVSKSHHEFSKDVVIIDIDEESLSVYANHPEVGRWPWKRSIYPLLYSFIGMGSPDLIINDILFTERSDEDESLVLANQSFPFISHAASLRTEDNNFLESEFPFANFSITNDSSHKFPAFQRGAFPNGDIGLSSQHIHIVNVIPDHDGILRRFAPILKLGDLGFPSLPVLGYFGSSPIQVQLEEDSIHLKSDEKSNSFTLNRDGFIRSYFYSPEILESIPRYSASAVLESYSRIQEGLIQDESELLVSPEIFANKIVLIGTTASSTHDDIVTPFGLYPGVIVQSVFISNLREGHFLTEIPEHYGLLFAILLIGITSILVYFISQEWVRLAIPILLIISLSLLYYVFYQMDLILPISQSLVSISFSILFGYAYLTYRDGLDKRKYSKVLRNLVDSSIVNLAIQDIDSLKNGGEWEITAFFSDIAGFSSISEELTASSLAELLNEYLSAMTLVLKKNSGTLDKYIGDAIVGMFGAPIQTSTHSNDACKTAVEMVRTLDELKIKWKSENIYPESVQNMRFRIGLNTGQAKVGFMGTDSLASYTMMGDTVNLASRLEAAAKDYGATILVSESIYECESENFHFCKLDVIRVMGKDRPVPIYSLLLEKSDPKEIPYPWVLSYEKGLSAYQNRNWDTAILDFQRSEKEYGGNLLAAQLLIERCATYKVTPPIESWDGVFSRTSK